MRKRNVDFDILRAGAILYIVAVWHIGDYLPNIHTYSEIPALFMQCALGLFVFISGLLLSQHYNLSTLSGVFHFLMRRILRVYPLFLLALTAFCFLGLVDFSMFAKSAFLTNMILNEGIITLWFVTMICLFYLILPFYLVNYRIEKTILLTLSVYILLLIIHRFFGLIDLRLAQYLIPFAFGIICARSQGVITLLYKNTTFAFSVLLWIVAVFIASNLDGELRIFAKDFVIIASIPISLVIAKKLRTIINHKFVGMLSYASFCIYLLHRITFELALLLYKSDNLLISVMYLYFIILPSTVLASYWVQYTYDFAITKVIFKNLLGSREAQIVDILGHSTGQEACDCSK